MSLTYLSLTLTSVRYTLHLVTLDYYVSDLLVPNVNVGEVGQEVDKGHSLQGIYSQYIHSIHSIFAYTNYYTVHLVTLDDCVPDLLVPNVDVSDVGQEVDKVHCLLGRHILYCLGEFHHVGFNVASWVMMSRLWVTFLISS